MSDSPPVCYRHPDREAHIRCQRCERVICPDCMRPAAVGFQCPECVAEGARTTRSGRTAYGGAIPADASRTSVVLIAINLAVWVAITATGGDSSRLVDWLALRPNGLCGLSGVFMDLDRSACTAQGGTWLPGVADGAVWQVLTAGFAHISVLHILFNMYALWILGPQLEASLGRVRFLALYLLSLLGGSVAVLWAGGEYQSALGASGAIYGLFAGLLLIARKVGADSSGLMVVIAINVALTFAIPNISWQGHLGGFAVGAAVAALLVHAPRGPRRTPFQAATLGLVAVVLVAAAAARALALA
ncbi:rhomboid family intramembrane serine protease [Nocardioides sp. SYSU D00038]|uniref:rhomboid family intramembrane serine protease n=1 Tax=Nocardioides sp. SYSU D00038 TaxID=2812554 RepID=UPI0027DAF7F9|nr:rhomboid family intramembrane serine protease [Nocardioides sp. SYSU D00038]